MRKRTFLSSLMVIILAACARATPTVVPVPTVSPAPEGTPTAQAIQPPWWREAIFYEIFVRSFYDTDGNGLGDFNGIAQKLDYLQKLGVNAIWLMPIHPSPSYHGYDVINYYAVNSDYGTMDDFKHLLQEVHKRGMHIILDLVINHTSSQHPWFIDANSNLDSKYRDYYVWSDTSQGNKWYPGKTGYYYAYFCDCMPDLNYRNPAVTSEMLKVTDYWLNTIGVDGFRVDAAKHLIEEGDRLENTSSTHEWYKTFYKAYKAQDTQAYTVGEAFGGGATIVKSYTGDQLDQMFNFEMASGFVNSANGGSNSGITSAIKFALQDMPDFNFATFLTNHDQNRAMSVFNGSTGKAKAAATLLLTTPGTPFIYYGEEIGMQGVKPDEDIRLPMQWNAETNAGFTAGTPWRPPAADYPQVNVAAQDQNPDSLLNYYRALTKLRMENPALNNGEITLVDTDNSAVYAALLRSPSEKILVFINLKGKRISDYQLSVNENVLTDGVITPRSLQGTIQIKPVKVSDGKFDGYKPVDELSPYGSYILQLE